MRTENFDSSLASEPGTTEKVIRSSVGPCDVMLEPLSLRTFQVKLGLASSQVTMLFRSTSEVAPGMTSTVTLLKTGSGLFAITRMRSGRSV